MVSGEDRAEEGRENDYFHMEQIMRHFGDIRTIAVNDWKTFLNCDHELGRADRLIRHVLDSPNTGALSEYEQSIVLNSLLMMGRGDLLKSGRLSLSFDETQPRLLSLASACLSQAGDFVATCKILIGLARKDSLSELELRYLILALSKLSGESESQDFRTKLGELKGLMPGRWLDYEQLRYGIFPPSPRALQIAGTADIRREKHVARLYPLVPDRVVVEKGEGEDFQLPARGVPGDIADRLEQFVDSVRGCLGEVRIARSLDFLSEVRARYATESGPPVQVISTGRAGTTALFQWLDASPAYMPYHSFSWQTTQVHRWGLVTRILTGDVSVEAIKPFVDMYLFCRISEILSAYRNGGTPVIVSHWDVIYAPISVVLFDTRFVHMKRDPLNVLRSMVVKRQYSCAQIAALPYRKLDAVAYELDPSDFSRDWGYHIGWYLAFTERFWDAMRQVFPEHCLGALSSDGLFSGDDATIGKLRDAFDMHDADVDKIRAHFSKRINEKVWKTSKMTHIVERILDDSIAKYMELSADGPAERDNGGR